MRPRDRELAARLAAGLQRFHRTKHHLPGIDDEITRAVLIEQLLESIHRVEYARRLREIKLSPLRMDPTNDLFDPLKAAVLYQRERKMDEAFWMVFLSVHFGKHARAGWRYAREIYGRMGEGGRWDWASTSSDPGSFRAWLHDHETALRRDGIPRGFGNHRKYESLDAYSNTGTGAVIESYVRWVDPVRGHEQLIRDALAETGGDPKKAFDVLYRSMNAVSRFGRTARFDYLTMLGKLGLAHIEPGSAYMTGATGPVRGAQRLFGARDEQNFDMLLVNLDAELGVGMQVLEDALCNWQKSPDQLIRFRG